MKKKKGKKKKKVQEDVACCVEITRGEIEKGEKGLFFYFS